MSLLSASLRPRHRGGITSPARTFLVSDSNAISFAVGAISGNGWGLMLREDNHSIFERGPAFARYLSSRAFGHGYLAMEITDALSDSGERLHSLTLSLPIPMGERATREFLAVSDRVAEQLERVGMLREGGEVVSSSTLPSSSLGRSTTFRAALRRLGRSR